MKTKQLTAAEIAATRYDVEFNDETGQIEITDTVDNLLFTVEATEDDVRIFANGGETAVVECGWNYRHEEPETCERHYSDLELDWTDKFDYVLANRSKWSVGVALQD